MLNMAIILLILITLAVHRYLSAYWEQGRLPYSFGFLVFVKLFCLVLLVSLIWMLGVVAGVIATALCLLQVVYSAGLWAFLLPSLLRMHKNPFAGVNLLVYGGFTYLVGLLALLTAVNFFVSPYKSVWALIREDALTYALVLGGILIVGNLARVVVLSVAVKE